VVRVQVERERERERYIQRKRERGEERACRKVNLEPNQQKLSLMIPGYLDTDSSIVFLGEEFIKI